MSKAIRVLHKLALDAYRSYMASPGAVEFALWVAAKNKLAKQLHKEAKR